MVGITYKYILWSLKTCALQCNECSSLFTIVFFFFLFPICFSRRATFCTIECTDRNVAGEFKGERETLFCFFFCFVLFPSCSFWTTVLDEYCYPLMTTFGFVYELFFFFWTCCIERNRERGRERERDEERRRREIFLFLIRVHTYIHTRTYIHK